jgi:hypothetical protein
LVTFEKPLQGIGEALLFRRLHATRAQTVAHPGIKALPPANQKKLLQLLIDKGGRANETEVRKHLGITKGQELAGVTANLSRNARREAKDDGVKAVKRVYEKGVRIYYIPDDLLQFLKQF